MAKIATLVDNFDAGWVEGVVWEKTSQSADSTKVTSAAGALRIDHTTGPQYNRLVSVNTYDLTASSLYCKILDFGNQALLSHVVNFGVWLDASNLTFFSVEQNLLDAYKTIAASQTSVGSSALDTSLHRWIRLREAGGTTFFDTAPDGVAWTNRYSVANPFVMNRLTVHPGPNPPSRTVEIVLFIRSLA